MADTDHQEIFTQAAHALIAGEDKLQRVQDLIEGYYSAFKQSKACAHYDLDVRIHGNQVIIIDPKNNDSMEIITRDNGSISINYYGPLKELKEEISIYSQSPEDTLHKTVKTAIYMWPLVAISNGQEHFLQTMLKASKQPQLDPSSL